MARVQPLFELVFSCVQFILQVTPRYEDEESIEESLACKVAFHHTRLEDFLKSVSFCSPLRVFKASQRK